MSRKANPTLIGAFVLGAIALAVVTTLLLAGGDWFGEKRQHVMYFEGAAQGLQVGAPVVFLGVKVGTVKKIQLGLDEQEPAASWCRSPSRCCPTSCARAAASRSTCATAPPCAQLVERGLRARLRMQSLLTGQLYVDLDFHPDKPARFVALDPDVSEIPTIRTAVQELTSQARRLPDGQVPRRRRRDQRRRSNTDVGAGHAGTAAAARRHAAPPRVAGDPARRPERPDPRRGAQGTGRRRRPRWPSSRPRPTASPRWPPPTRTWCRT